MSAGADAARAPSWHRRVWRLAVPIMLANLTVPLIGAVDVAVVGRLPDPAAIGAVALGALVFSFLYWGFGFLRMGTTGFVAQAHGAGDGDELRAVLARGLLLAVAIGGLIVAAQAAIGWAAFALIGAGEDSGRQGRLYFDIRVWGAPATLANFVVLGWLLGVQRPALGLVVQVAMNLLNVALVLLFGVGLGWGLAGVAAGTLVAEYAGAAIGVATVRRALSGVPGEFDRSDVLDGRALARMVAVNRDIFLRTLSLILAFAWFTASGARQGDAVLAANAVLMQMHGFVSYALDGLAHATEALVGQAVGARDRAGLGAAIRTALLWSVGIAACLSVALALWGGAFIDLFTTHAPIRELARHYLPFAVALPLVGVWCYQLDGVYIGATRTAEMRNGMVLAFLAFLVVHVTALPVLGNAGLWLAFLTFLAVRGLTLGLWLPRVLKSV